MKLAIMQPYFFPYLGYFDLINYSDRWIVFDDVQYIRHGWINRNRILHPTSGWSYILAPVKSSRSMRIREVEFANQGEWKSRILGQLRHYQKHAPYYKDTINLLEECFTFEGNSVCQFNVFSLAKVCAYLGINFHYDIFSDMGLQLGPIEGPGDWALRISEALGVQEYVNPPGGEDLFDRTRFEENKIELTIRRLPTFEYECPPYEFVPNLSILELMMWNPPQKIAGYLKEHLK
jgi:hypothetical protein